MAHKRVRGETGEGHERGLGGEVEARQEGAGAGGENVFEGQAGEPVGQPVATDEDLLLRPLDGGEWLVGGQYHQPVLWGKARNGAVQACRPRRRPTFLLPREEFCSSPVERRGLSRGFFLVAGKIPGLRTPSLFWNPHAEGSIPLLKTNND